MASDNRVLVDDGQFITHDDFNDAQRFNRAHANDSILAQRCKLSPADNSPPVHVLYTEKNAARPYASATALRVSVAAGLIAQQVGTVDGLTPALLSYRLDPAVDTLDFNLSAGTPAFYRVDGIFVKISLEDADNQTRTFYDALIDGGVADTTDTKRRTRVDFQVVQGTNYAGPPLRPATPAGYVPLAFVYVPPSYNAAFVDSTHLRDMRIPMGLRGVQCNFQGADPATGTTAWTHDGLGGVFCAGSAGSYLYVPIPGDLGSKLVGIQVFGKYPNHASCTVQLIRRSFDGTNTVTDSVIKTYTANTLVSASGGYTPFYMPAAGPYDDDDSNLHTTLWMTGYRVPTGPTVATGAYSRLYLKLVSGNTGISTNKDIIGPLTFYMAGD